MQLSSRFSYFLGIRTRDDGNGLEEEENFEEALKAVNTALEHTRIPSEVTAILADPKCSNLVNSFIPVVIEMTKKCGTSRVQHCSK